MVDVKGTCYLGRKQAGHFMTFIPGGIANVEKQMGDVLIDGIKIHVT